MIEQKERYIYYCSIYTIGSSYPVLMGLQGSQLGLVLSQVKIGYAWRNSILHRYIDK